MPVAGRASAPPGWRLETYAARVPKRQFRLPDGASAEIEAAFTELRRQLDVTLGFGDDVLADAERATRARE